MRIHSISEVNTHQQQNPFVATNAGLASAGKTASELTFEELLRNQIQQASAAAVTGKPESHIAGLYWGYYPTLKEEQKSEPAPKSRAS